MPVKVVQSEVTPPFPVNSKQVSRYQITFRLITIIRGVAASRFLGRQDVVAYKELVLTLGSMITIPMVWSM